MELKRKYNPYAANKAQAQAKRSRGSNPMYRPTKTVIARPLRIAGNPQQYGRYTQSRPGGEVKGLDVTNATTCTTNTVVAWTLNATGKLNCLNLITTGSSSWNRIGRKVALKSFRLRGFLTATNNAAAGPEGPILQRMVLLYDKQPNGALPTIGDIFLDQASVAADSSNTSVTSGLNLNNRDRFEVLLDRQYYSPPTNTGTGLSTNTGLVATCDPMTFDWYIHLRNREVHYKADSSPAVIGDIATGSLVFITFGNVTAGQEPYSLTASIRIRYSDL